MRAIVSRSRPRALAICDRCGFRYNHDQLKWQYDWRGPRLQNLRILVCKTCLDVPQENLRTIVLPPDPVPIRDPRPENVTANNSNLITPSFSGWTLTGATLAIDTSETAPDGTMTAWRLQETTANSLHQAVLQLNGILTTGDQYTFSVFAKGGEVNELNIEYLDSALITDFANAILKANNPERFVAQEGGNFIDTQLAMAGGWFFRNVGNGWWWIGFTETAQNNAGALAIYLNRPPLTGPYFYAGDGTSGSFYWQPQVVAGTFAVPPTNALTGSFTTSGEGV